MTKIGAHHFSLTGIVLVLISMSTGCATVGKSMALGGGIGAGAGAIAGGIADPGKDGEYRTRNVLIGSAIGGMAGLISGAAIQGAMDDQKKEAFQEGKAAGTGSLRGTQAPSLPSLHDPQVEARWVEPKVAGNRYIEGHFEYVIVSPARWESH